MPTSPNQIFEMHRSRLFGLAYAMTGSVSEAEDIVQESFLKWFTVDQAMIASPEAWLVRIATRLALDHLKSAQVQRRSYVGPWLPEPLIVDPAHPESELELDQSISMALMVVLERLTPAERASFILHDLFHFPFEEVSILLEKPNGTCRKLASRARQKIGPITSATPVTKASYQKVVPAFLGAIKSGDMGDLMAVLKADVVLHADGGGKAAAAKEILCGQATVADFLLTKLHPLFQRVGSLKMVVAETWFNGAPGLVFWLGGKPVTAFDFQMAGNQIQKIHALRNPDKLQVFCRDLNGNFRLES